MRALLVLLVMAAIAWYEGPPLIQQGQKREAALFWIVWFLALAYAVSVAIGWNVPNPMDWIETVFGPVTAIGLPES